MGPSDKSPSYWADPTVASQWDAAREKLSSGKLLRTRRLTPVILSNQKDALVLKNIAGLVETPDQKPTILVSRDNAETGETQTVSICSVSDEVIKRLDGWIDESNERLVRFDGKPRYAGTFMPLAKPWNLKGLTKNSTKPVRVLSLGDQTGSQPYALVAFVNALIKLKGLNLQQRIPFDLIGGVGFGGITSLYLDSTLDFPEFANRPFFHDFPKFANRPFFHDFPKFANWPVSHHLPERYKWEDAQLLQAEQTQEKNWPFVSATSDLHMFVIAITKQNEEVLLRRYHSPDSHMLSERSSIGAAIKATCVAVDKDSDTIFGQLLDRVKEIEPVIFTTRKPPGLIRSDPIYHVYREARSIWPDRDIRIASFMPKPPGTNLPEDEAMMEIRGFEYDSSIGGKECHLIRADDTENFDVPSFHDKVRSFWADGVS